MNDEFNDVVEETTENTDAQTVEETEEGIELTDTANTETNSDDADNVEVEEKGEEKPQGRYVTDDELNEIVEKRVARKMSRLDREHQKELSMYKDTDNILRSALKVSDNENVNQKLREYYENEGVTLPSRYEPGLSSREIEALANLDVEDIIADGDDAMVAEANRLANKGYDNLNEKERFIFNKLAETLTNKKNETELLSLGAKKELLTDKKFNDFRKMFNPNTPIKDIYELYVSRQPKQKAENPGSMKNTDTGDKDFISEAEYDKMTRAEIRANMDLIEKSMAKW